MAADTTAAHSIVKMKIDEDKIKTLSPHLLMAYSGEPGEYYTFNALHFTNLFSLPFDIGDTVQFAEYVERNIRLYQIRNLYPLRPSAAASWIRRALAESLRSRSPYSVNLLLGGYDTATEDPHLYWMDYLGTVAEVPYAAHGYGAYFVLSLLDRYGFFMEEYSLETDSLPQISRPECATRRRSRNAQTLYRSSLEATCC